MNFFLIFFDVLLKKKKKINEKKLLAHPICIRNKTRYVLFFLVEEKWGKGDQIRGEPSSPLTSPYVCARSIFLQFYLVSSLSPRDHTGGNVSFFFFVSVARIHRLLKIERNARSFFNLRSRQSPAREKKK